MPVEDSMTLHVGQIVDGWPKCVSCEQQADWMISTGPDPEPEPVCHEHAAGDVQMVADVIRSISERERIASAAKRLAK